jgi:hypothetical protein
MRAKIQSAHTMQKHQETFPYAKVAALNVYHTSFAKLVVRMVTESLFNRNPPKRKGG